jgi:hypothetical protein
MAANAAQPTDQATQYLLDFPPALFLGFHFQKRGAIFLFPVGGFGHGLGFA